VRQGAPGGGQALLGALEGPGPFGGARGGRAHSTYWLGGLGERWLGWLFVKQARLGVWPGSASWLGRLGEEAAARTRHLLPTYSNTHLAYPALIHVSLKSLAARECGPTCHDQRRPQHGLSKGCGALWHIPTPQVNDKTMVVSSKIKYRCSPRLLTPTPNPPGLGRNVGFISFILPRACIIQADRHPVSSGLSCYAQPFEGRGTLWAFNLTGAPAGHWVEPLCTLHPCLQRTHLHRVSLACAGLEWGLGCGMGVVGACWVAALLGLRWPCLGRQSGC
jgi:hypothetical protein